MRHAALMEKIAEEKKMFVIAPMISHSLATNMAFGTKNEEFLVEECPEIFRFLYPVSEKKEDNYIFGIHTGAYGAVKLAMKHPDVYAGCFAEMCIRDRYRTLFDLSGVLMLCALVFFILVTGKEK